MISRWIALLGLAALLSACAAPRGEQHVQEPWNGGIWNSVLGYIGPYNQMANGPGR